MKIISSPQFLQQDILRLKKEGKHVGFVPTMGNLHNGHLSLVNLIQPYCDVIVFSIFINPAQFSANEDFNSYPKTLREDIQKLDKLNVDYLFTPQNVDIYPFGSPRTTTKLHKLTQKLCGVSRPDHFKGVTTIINILFNIVLPDVAAFGKKDYQQYQIIKLMTEDLFLPIKIIGGEIIREPDGLAMSSRNRYLTDEERKKAILLHQSILATSHKINSGISFEQATESAIKKLKENTFKVDYFEIVKRNNLKSAKHGDKKLLIAAAAWLGRSRLIDNQEVNL